MTTPPEQSPAACSHDPRESSGRYFQLSENESVRFVALLVAFTFLALLFLRNFYMTDPDFGWHLRAGEWILFTDADCLFERTALRRAVFYAEQQRLDHLVVVPTAYPDLTEARIRQLGNIGMVIYGNHAVRAAVTAMRQIFAEIRADGGIHNIDKRIVSVEEIFELQRVAEMKRTEQKYLR